MAARERPPSPTAGIVCGGGWKHSQRTDRLKVKAWVALFVAIGFGHVAVAWAGPAWVLVLVPAGVCLIASIYWFWFERAREFKATYHYEAEENPHNLYAAQFTSAADGDLGHRHQR